jgi:hypothetical protein
MKSLSTKPKDNVDAPDNPFAAATPSVNIVVIFDSPRHLAEARGLRRSPFVGPKMAVS